MFFITIPNIMLNLYLVAFVYYTATSDIYKACLYMEIVFALEIFLSFFTSFMDKESDLKINLK